MGRANAWIRGYVSFDQLCGQCKRNFSLEGSVLTLVLDKKGRGK